MDALQPIPCAVVVAAAVVAGVTDIWKFKVYNALTLPLLVAGLMYHGFHDGAPGLMLSAIGMLCGFGVLILFFLLGGYGGGDVKLLAAFGAWLGPEAVLYVFIAGSLVAGVYALGLVLLYGTFGEIWTRWKVLWYRLAALGRHLGSDDGCAIEQNQIDRRRRVPFATMLCLGVIATFAYLWYKRSSG